jgi:hypothetical protein
MMKHFSIKVNKIGILRLFRKQDWKAKGQGNSVIAKIEIFLDDLR